MFLTLLLATFLISVLVTSLVVLLLQKPVDRILKRIIADAISDAWTRYIIFGLYVIGISRGVQIDQLERYATPTGSEDGEVLTLTTERWILEVYRTVIGVLEGLAEVLVEFFIVALLAFVIVRFLEVRRAAGEPRKPAGEDS